MDLNLSNSILLISSPKAFPLKPCCFLSLAGRSLLYESLLGSLRSWLDPLLPISASAICCARVAGIVTGDIAPINKNGVITIGWPAKTYSRIESNMRSSQRSGELQFTNEINTGVSSIALRPPWMISAIAITSLALVAETTLPIKNLSVNVACANAISKWRESSERSFGSTTTPPTESSTS